MTRFFRGPRQDSLARRVAVTASLWLGVVAIVATQLSGRSGATVQSTSTKQAEISRIVNDSPVVLKYRLAESAGEAGTAHVLAPGAVQHVTWSPGTRSTPQRLTLVAPKQAGPIAIRPQRTYRWSTADKDPTNLDCEETRGVHATDGIRRLNVVVVAGEAYRRFHPSWISRTRWIVAAASRHFEAEFGVRIVIKETRRWSFGQAPRTAGDALEQLHRQVGTADADVVIAFTLFSFPGAQRGAEIRGLSQYFSQYLVVPDEWAVEGAKLRLVHELGHVFGAFHDRQPGSIMAPSFRGAPPALIFSCPMRRQLATTREHDFAEGVESFDNQTAIDLQRWYVADRHRSEPIERDPISAALEHLADRAEWDGNAERAAELRAKAIETRKRVKSLTDASNSN